MSRALNLAGSARSFSSAVRARRRHAWTVVIGLALTMPLLAEDALVSGPPALLGDRSAPCAASVKLPQCFIEDDARFLMLGDELSAALETARMHWIVSDRESKEHSVVTIEPIGGRADAEPTGEALRPGVVSRFHGAPENWKSARRTFGTVRYADLWTGIDLKLEAMGTTLKGTYTVAPDADPHDIVLRHHGADDVTIDDDGRLVIATPSGSVIDAAPVAWQLVDGEHRDVDVGFRVTASEDEAFDVTFSVGHYDTSRPLLIDPAVIVTAGFLGGADDDNPSAIEVDDVGNVYVSGSTRSTEASFPVLVGPELTWDGPFFPPHGDAFIAKLDPNGTLLYAGFLGGTELDYINGLAVDSLGRAYVGGYTRSEEYNGFPVKNGPDLTYNFGGDGWVARVAADGSTLDYCGYIGGNSGDRVFGVDVDELFRMYVVGRFKSLPATLPLQGGPFLTEPGGATDSFIARVSPNGTTLEYCGYLGGDDQEDITEVVADKFGGAWFSGWTWSTNFPSVGSLGPVHNGSIEAVVGRVAINGSSLTSCGFIGGLGSEFPISLELDDVGSVYVSGVTHDPSTFPTLIGPNLVPANPTVTGFISKVSANGQSLVWSGFTGTGFTADISIAEDQTLWVLTAQSDGTPTGSNPLIGRVSTSGDDLEHVVLIDLPDGTTLSFIDAVPTSLTPGATDLWLAGRSTDDELTVPVVGGPDLMANGMTDTVVMKLRITDGPWADVGFGLAGTYGAPVLTGTGTLQPLTPMELNVTGALESTPCWLIFGLNTLYAPFRGGTMVPDPAPPGFIVPFSTSAAGTWTLPATWPSGIPSGFSIYVQLWVSDAAGPVNFAASNGLQGTTP